MLSGTLVSAVPLPSIQPAARAGENLVVLRGVAMRFGATRAVDGVDLDLNRGEIHGLIGENGAGKSTLMRVLAGFFDDYDGAIAIDGRQRRLTNSGASARAKESRSCIRSSVYFPSSPSPRTSFSDASRGDGSRA